MYSVPIPTSITQKVVEPIALTDTTKQGYYSTRFSPGAAFYVLSYHGPTTPWTKVVDVDRPGESSPSALRSLAIRSPRRTYARARRLIWRSLRGALSFLSLSWLVGVRAHWLAG